MNSSTSVPEKRDTSAWLMIRTVIIHQQSGGQLSHSGLAGKLFINKAESVFGDPYIFTNRLRRVVSVSLTSSM